MQHTAYSVRVIRIQRTSDTSVDITFERLLRNAICLQNLRRTLQYETLNNMVKQTAYSIEPTYNIKYQFESKKKEGGVSPLQRTHFVFGIFGERYSTKR